MDKNFNGQTSETPTRQPNGSYYEQDIFWSVLGTAFLKLNVPAVMLSSARLSVEVLS